MSDEAVEMPRAAEAAPEAEVNPFAFTESDLEQPAEIVSSETEEPQATSEYEFNLGDDSSIPPYLHGGLAERAQQLFFPALFFCLTLLALNFLGDGLRDAIAPKSAKD